MAVVALALLFTPFVFVITAVLCLYIYRRFYAHQFFEREGIPGPKPHWLLGNALEFAKPETRHLVLPRWTKQYGKLFGYYEGSRPTLVTSDVNFVMQTFVKQFPSFHGRKTIPTAPDPDTNTEAISMLLARGERWKRLRTIANPMFSAGKMRALMPLMNKCQEDFMELIDKRAAIGEAFNIFQCFKFLTLDTISETAFGIELNSAKSDGKDNVILTNMNEMLKTIFALSAAMKIGTVVPEMSKLLRRWEKLRATWFHSGMMKYRNAIYDALNQIIAGRKANPELQKRQDLLQMMLDSETLDVAKSDLKGLTSDEIKGQAVLFMIAGFETSSNALAFTAFLLANNPHVQDKLISEIDKHFADGKKVDYDSVYELPYLEGVILETLRLFPIAPLIVNRLAMEDTSIDGIRIPKGLPIMADIWTIHRDEEQWGPVNTELFHPERFLDEYPTKATRSEAAFLPFGFGPRICIGQRFALLEMKLTLVNLLRKYRIEKSPQTGDSLRLLASFTITPVDGIWIRLKTRSL